MEAAKLEEILKRGNVRRGQITLFKMLYEEEGWVSRSELAAIRDVDSIDAKPEESLTGVIGGLGKRVNSTPNVDGSPGYQAFVEKRGRGDGTRYRLRSEARKAVERDECLMDMIERPMSELTEQGTKLER